jgi:general secretion pathway protein H
MPGAKARMRILRTGPISGNNHKKPDLICHGRRRGFTLLELMVVLVIIGLMSAIVVPRFTVSMTNLDLKTAAQKISASLRYVRSNAASEKTTYVALFDFDHNRVVITHYKAHPLVRGNLYIREPKVHDRMPIEASDDEKELSGAIKTYALPEGIKLAKGVSTEGDFDSGLFRIFFYPSGGSSGGEIIVANERGRQYRINVDFITGSVQLFEVSA